MQQILTGECFFYFDCRDVAVSCIVFAITKIIIGYDARRIIQTLYIAHRANIQERWHYPRRDKSTMALVASQ